MEELLRKYGLELNKIKSSAHFWKNFQVSFLFILQHHEKVE